MYTATGRAVRSRRTGRCNEGSVWRMPTNFKKKMATRTPPEKHVQRRRSLEKGRQGEASSAARRRAVEARRRGGAAGAASAGGGGGAGGGEAARMWALSSGEACIKDLLNRLRAHCARWSEVLNYQCTAPTTHPPSAFPARADSSDETYVSVASLPAIPRHVRMNPFILCPGGPNGSSAAQIELERANLELPRCRDVRMRSVCEVRDLGHDRRK
jgi:hypothetical protein